MLWKCLLLCMPVSENGVTILFFFFLSHGFLFKVVLEPFRLLQVFLREGYL